MESKKGHRIVVVGDSCIDRFVYCGCERLCPEAPVPVLDVRHVEDNRGMAGNVIENVRSLNNGICAEWINKNEKQITKTRYVEEKTNHMFIRIDHTEPIERAKELYELDNLDLDAIIISDYCKGFLTEEDIRFIASLKPVTFLDTKKKLGAWAKHVDFININRKEYKESEYEIQVNSLRNQIVQTLGPDGAEYRGTNYPVDGVEIKDLSGAGDTFLAGLCVEYLNSRDISKAIEFANECSTKVVQRKGVSIV